MSRPSLVPDAAHVVRRLASAVVDAGSIERCRRVADGVDPFAFYTTRIDTFDDIERELAGQPLSSFPGISHRGREVIAQRHAGNARKALNSWFGLRDGATPWGTLWAWEHPDLLSAIGVACRVNTLRILTNQGVDSEYTHVAWIVIQGMREQLGLVPFFYVSVVHYIGDDSPFHSLVCAVRRSILAYALNRERLVPIVCMVGTTSRRPDAHGHQVGVLITPSRSAGGGLMFTTTTLNTGDESFASESYRAIDAALAKAAKPMRDGVYAFPVEISSECTRLEYDIQSELDTCSLLTIALTAVALRAYSDHVSIAHVLDPLHDIGHPAVAPDSFLVLDASLEFAFHAIGERMHNVQRVLTVDPRTGLVNSGAARAFARSSLANMHADPVMATNSIAIRRALALGICPSAGIAPLAPDLRGSVYYNYGDTHQSDPTSGRIKEAFVHIFWVLRRIDALRGPARRRRPALAPVSPAPATITGVPVIIAPAAWAPDYPVLCRRRTPMSHDSPI